MNDNELVAYLAAAIGELSAAQIEAIRVRFELAVRAGDLARARTELEGALACLASDGPRRALGAGAPDPAVVAGPPSTPLDPKTLAIIRSLLSASKP